MILITKSSLLPLQSSPWETHCQSPQVLVKSRPAYVNSSDSSLQLVRWEFDPVVSMDLNLYFLLIFYNDLFIYFVHCVWRLWGGVNVCESEEDLMDSVLCFTWVTGTDLKLPGLHGSNVTEPSWHSSILFLNCGIPDGVKWNLLLFWLASLLWLMMLSIFSSRS